MQQRVLAANVENYRQLRREIHDVREVLLGADAEVDAAGRERFLKGGNDVLVRLLVRDEILGRERTAALRHAREELPELAIGERIGDARRALRHAYGGRGDARERVEQRDACETRASV